MVQTEHQILTAHYDQRTASSLVFELFAVEGDPVAGANAYRAERLQPLLARGATTGVNLFRLREQQVPAAPLAEGLHSQLTPALAERLGIQLLEPGPAKPLPSAVFGASFQLPSDDLHALEPALAATKLGSGRRTLSLAAYAKVADFGRPNPVGDPPFQSAMIVFTHPTDLGYAERFEDWYSNNHMIDAAKSPPYRSATRYRVTKIVEGIPLPYLCIYEIEAPYSPQIHQGMMHQIGVLPWAQRQSHPATPAGQPVLTIDCWGYYERAWAGER